MKPRASLRPGELGFAALLVLGSLYVFREAFAISGFSGLTTGGMMPMLAAGIMVLSGVSILRDALLRREGWRPDIRVTAGFLFSWRLLVVVLLVVLFALAIPWIGFIAGASLFLFVTICFLWRGRVLLSAGVTALSIAVIYALFRIVFQVVLPQGAIWQ